MVPASASTVLSLGNMALGMCLNQPSSKGSAPGISGLPEIIESFFLPGLRTIIFQFFKPLSNNCRDFWETQAISYFRSINIIIFYWSLTQQRIVELLGSRVVLQLGVNFASGKGVFPDSGDDGLGKWRKKRQGYWICLTSLKLEFCRIRSGLNPMIMCPFKICVPGGWQQQGRQMFALKDPCLYK